VKKITLTHQTSSGSQLKATFLPEHGMNLVSYQKDGVEVIAQSTWNLFEERHAGLGALIGPHFHRRLPELIQPVKHEERFPHIAKVKAKGIAEPFSHGIARYAPWQVESSEQTIQAHLFGKDLWQGVPLKELEGQDFQISFLISLKEEGLHFNLAIESELPSLMGLHYYYHLPKGPALVKSRVKNQGPIHSSFPPSTVDVKMDQGQYLDFDLNQEVDSTFYPYPDPLQSEVILQTTEYELSTRYRCANEENCWQLYHPKEASFVCIEPMSSKDPRHPKQTFSQLEVQLKITLP